MDTYNEYELDIVKELTQADIYQLIVLSNEIMIVSKPYQEKGYAVLKERIANGEDPKKILGVTDPYYLDKLLSGLCWLTDCLYYRVMGSLPYANEDFCRFHTNCRAVQSLIQAKARQNGWTPKKYVQDRHQTGRGMTEEEYEKYLWDCNFKQVHRLCVDMCYYDKKDTEARDRLKKIYDSYYPNEIAFDNAFYPLRLQKISFNDWCLKKEKERLYS